MTPQDVPLKEYFDALMHAYDRLYTERAKAQQLALDAAMEVAKEQVAKAGASSQQRLSIIAIIVSSAGIVLAAVAIIMHVTQ